MNKLLVVAAVAAMLAAALPSSAQARCGGCGVAAGVVGGLAAGAIIGSAIANSNRPVYVEEPPVYAAPPLPPPAYVEEYSAGPVCHFERHRFWDGYGWRNERVEVCD